MKMSQPSTRLWVDRLHVKIEECVIKIEKEKGEQKEAKNRRGFSLVTYSLAGQHYHCK